jgi:hypothetical protein
MGVSITLITCVCQSDMQHTLRQRNMCSYKLRWFPGKHVYDTIKSSIHSYGHMPVPKNYDGFRKEGSEHGCDELESGIHSYGHIPVLTNYEGFKKEGSDNDVDHMSVMTSKPAHTHMVIYLFLQITMGFC